MAPYVPVSVLSWSPPSVVHAILTMHRTAGVRTGRRRKSKKVIVHDYSDRNQVALGYTLSVKKRKKGKFDAKVRRWRAARGPRA